MHVNKEPGLAEMSDDLKVSLVVSSKYNVQDKMVYFGHVLEWLSHAVSVVAI